MVGESRDFHKTSACEKHISGIMCENPREATPPPPRCRRPWTDVFLTIRIWTMLKFCV